MFVIHHHQLTMHHSFSLKLEISTIARIVISSSTFFALRQIYLKKWPLKIYLIICVLGKKRYFYLFLFSMTFWYFREKEGHFKGHKEEEFNINSNKKGFRAMAWSTILCVIRKLWKIANYLKIELWLDSSNWSALFVRKLIQKTQHQYLYSLFSAKFIHLHLVGNNTHIKFHLAICQ